MFGWVQKILGESYKKFLLSAVTFVLVLFNKKLGLNLDDQTIAVVAGALVAYIVAQTAQDMNKVNTAALAASAPAAVLVRTSETRPVDDTNAKVGG